jgi:hypothetical protein
MSASRFKLSAVARRFFQIDEVTNYMFRDDVVGETAWLISSACI